MKNTSDERHSLSIDPAKLSSTDQHTVLELDAAVTEANLLLVIAEKKLLEARIAVNTANMVFCKANEALVDLEIKLLTRYGNSILKKLS